MTAPRVTKDCAHVDAGTLSKPVRTTEGFLRADAHVTRAGVFRYANADGSRRLEYRPDEEVFKQDSLDSLRSLPVTDDHPPGLLDAGNASEYARGSLGEQPRRDGALVAIGMLVTDGALVSKLESGKARQTSCGYRCDLEWTPGTAPDGSRYDAVQRNIRYNHLAVVPKGRAGSDVAVRMDAAAMDAADVSDITTFPPVQRMDSKTIRIDGIDFPADSDGAVQALAKMEEKHRADAAAKDKAHADLMARFDAAEKARLALVTEYDKAKKDAEELPAKLKAQIEARQALETKARKVLGDKVSLDGLDEKAVQLKVLAKLAPKTKMDAKSDAQIDARFDAELERFDAEATKDDAGGEPHTDNDEPADGDEPPARLDADEERKKMLKATTAAWKRPVGASLAEGGRGLNISRE